MIFMVEERNFNEFIYTGMVNLNSYQTIDESDPDVIFLLNKISSQSGLTVIRAQKNSQKIRVVYVTQAN